VTAAYARLAHPDLARRVTADQNGLVGEDEDPSAQRGRAVDHESR
jgi:hypothetical protein